MSTLTLTTYGGLVDAVAAWLNRSDLTDYIPALIDLAHSDINSDVRHWRMYNRSRTTLDGTSGYVALPNDFEAPKHIILIQSPVVKLDVVTPEQLLQFRMTHGEVSGTPRWAAVEEELHLYPTPPADTVMEMLYYQTISGMSSDADYNWCLQRFPALYLYGALKNAAPFLHEDDRVPLWDTLYEKTLRSVRKDQGDIDHESHSNLPAYVF